MLCVFWYGSWWTQRRRTASRHWCIFSLTPSRKGFQMTWTLPLSFFMLRRLQEVSRCANPTLLAMPHERHIFYFSACWCSALMPVLAGEKNIWCIKCPAPTSPKTSRLGNLSNLQKDQKNWSFKEKLLWYCLGVVQYVSKHSVKRLTSVTVQLYWHTNCIILSLVEISSVLCIAYIKALE